MIYLTGLTNVGTAVEAGRHVAANLTHKLGLIRLAQSAIASRHRHKVAAHQSPLFMFCWTQRQRRRVVISIWRHYKYIRVQHEHLQSYRHLRLFPSSYIKNCVSVSARKQVSKLKSPHQDLGSEAVKLPKKFIPIATTVENSYRSTEVTRHGFCTRNKFQNTFLHKTSTKRSLLHCHVPAVCKT